MAFNFITSKTNAELGSWGRSMGFFLVFFPEESSPNHHKKKPSNFNRSANSIHLLYTTFSICLLLVFFSVLVFTLSTLPSSSTAARRRYAVPRRQLSLEFNSNLSHALQGMGVLYRRGVRAMADLVVAHAAESLTQHELRLFVRLFYRSSLASRSDLLFIFPKRSSVFDEVILQENDSFLQLLAHYGKKSGNDSGSHSGRSFDATRFLKLSRKERESGESIWGRRSRSNFSKAGAAESTQPSYGSVVSFDADELDPEKSLSGFLDHAPMTLRRWACYPMLLGRVRRNFKHAILVDMKEFLLMGDPLTRVRTHRPESVILKPATRRRSSDKTHPTRIRPVHPGIIMGGLRGIRRLSGEMLTSIVRMSMQQQRRKKNLFLESDLFNQLIVNKYALRNVNLITSTESVPELSSVIKSGPHLLTKNHSVIRRGNSNVDLDSALMKHICLFPEGSTVYSSS